MGGVVTDIEQLGLAIQPTPAMLRGDQTVWMHSHCGTVVVLSSPTKGQPPKDRCPGCDTEAPWRKQRLPVAGLHRTDEEERP